MLAQHVLKVSGYCILITGLIELCFTQCGGECDSAQIIALHLIYNLVVINFELLIFILFMIILKKNYLTNFDK